MALGSLIVESEKSKDKSKAKKRYLKRKKDRRKNRKSAAPKKPNEALPAAQQREEPDNHTSSSEDSDSNESADDDSGAEVVDKPTKKVDVVADAKRPKKKPKTAEDDGDVEMADPDQSDTVNFEPGEQPAQPITRRSLTLPSFPLPTLPNPPPKSVLALQGLDQALVDAEIVDPTTLLPIPSDGDDDAGTGLTEKTRKRLKELGITELFAVQTALLPFLLPTNRFHRSLYLPYDPPRDVCASAPTGSGKTLAYVLPIVELLSSRIITRLRALVVLPTRDLVTQVRETFEAISKGRGLKIGSATGQHSFAHEQTQLVANSSSHLQGGSSKVDILICTPGRLMDHINGTPNFSLQHLRFLVIDEADRLLAQSFQDWLAQVLAATRPTQLHTVRQLSIPDPTTTATTQIGPMPYADGLSPAFLHLHSASDFRTDIDEPKMSSCQKLLFSATLTRDPGKVAALELRNPKYFIVQSPTEGSSEMMDIVEKFNMPATLTEHMIVCESSQKPLMLFHLVHTYHVMNALVFTKSTESTTRLVRLFEFFETARAAEHGGEDRQHIVIRAYSSDSGPGERKTILEKFKAREIQILVCSDLISRGIDISHVSHVISYDAPVDMRKYVHRVGRTARAGRAGDAWALIEEQEARYFKAMLKAADHLKKVGRQRVSEKDLAPLLPHYEVALGSLREVYGK